MDFLVSDDELEKEYTALKTKENEEQIELRRLRTENNLLRQRIDGLEKESASLADRLIHDQVTRAQEAEEMYALKNDLAVTRSQLVETQKRLETADVLLADIKKRTNSIDNAGKLEETEARALVCQLQEELIAVRLREAETTTMVKELRTKIKELEDTNLQLQRAPSNDVQHLQEELVAVKLREAESNLSLKELRQKVNELETYWERHLERVFATGSGASPKEKSSKQEVRQLQDDLMTVRLREANAVAEIKDCKQKIMELETQNHICTNQIRRMDDENKVLKDKIQEKEQKEKELVSQTKELLRKIDDLESKRREEMMMVRIQEAETAQQMGELRQRIAQLEIQKEEMRAAGQLDVKEGTQDLEDKIYDLQDEVMQLRLQASPKHGGPSRTGQENHNGADEEEEDNEDDDDDDDEDVMESTQNLNKTLSDIIEGRSFVDTSLESSRLQEEETSAEVKSESSGFTKDTAVLDSSAAPHTNGALPPTEGAPPGDCLSQPEVAADG